MKSNFSLENQNFPASNREKEQIKRNDTDIEVAHLLVLLSNQNPNPAVSTFSVYTGNIGYPQHQEYSQADYPPDPYHSDYQADYQADYHQAEYPPEYPESYHSDYQADYHQADYHQADYHQADYHQADYHQAYSSYNHGHTHSHANPNYKAYPSPPQQKQQQQQQQQQQSFSQPKNSYYEAFPYQQEKPKRGSSSPTATATPPGTKKLVLAPSGLPCPNCGIETSTLWRNCDLLDGSKYLCNACGLRFKKGKYCPLCYEVYYDADTNHFNWEQCRSCTNWTHKACIQKSSGLPTVFGYICKLCSNTRAGAISPQPMEQMKSYSVEKNRSGGPGV